MSSLALTLQFQNTEINTKLGQLEEFNFADLKQKEIHHKIVAAIKAERNKKMANDLIAGMDVYINLFQAIKTLNTQVDSIQPGSDVKVALTSLANEMKDFTEMVSVSHADILSKNATKEMNYISTAIKATNEFIRNPGNVEKETALKQATNDLNHFKESNILKIATGCAKVIAAIGLTILAAKIAVAALFMSSFTFGLTAFVGSWLFVRFGAPAITQSGVLDLAAPSSGKTIATRNLQSKLGLLGSRNVANNLIEAEQPLLNQTRALAI